MLTPPVLSFSVIHTRIGCFVLLGSERGVRQLQWVESQDAGLAWIEKHVPQAMQIDGFYASTAQSIEAYLAGKGALNVPYDLAGGTALQRMVWIAISKLGYGETVSYTALAQRIGFSNAVRAVASACGANPLPLIIPCHRVVAKDGGIGGFSMGPRGLEIKADLLAMEAQAGQRKDTNAA